MVSPTPPSVARLRWVPRALALASIGVALALPGLAQEVEPAPEKPPEPASQAIPAEQVPERTRKTRLRATEIAGDAEPAAEIVAIVEELPEQRAYLTRAARDAKERLIDQAPANVLSNLRAEWTGYAVTLAAKRQVLARRAEALGADLQVLTKLEEPWAETLATATAENLPAALIGRIDETIAAAAMARETVMKRRSEVLTVQDEIVELESTVESVLSSIDAERKEQREQLAVFDSPPLWSPESWVQRRDDLLASFRSSWEEELALTQGYAAARTAQVTRYVLLFLGLIVLVLLLENS